MNASVVCYSCHRSPKAQSSSAQEYENLVNDDFRRFLYSYEATVQMLVDLKKTSWTKTHLTGPGAATVIVRGIRSIRGINAHVRITPVRPAQVVYIGFGQGGSPREVRSPRLHDADAVDQRRPITVADLPDWNNNSDRPEATERQRVNPDQLVRNSGRPFTGGALPWSDLADWLAFPVRRPPTMAAGGSEMVSALGG